MLESIFLQQPQPMLHLVSLSAGLPSMGAVAAASYSGQLLAVCLKCCSAADL
jgi:hypothetical protein